MKGSGTTAHIGVRFLVLLFAVCSSTFFACGFVTSVSVQIQHNQPLVLPHYTLPPPFPAQVAPPSPVPYDEQLGITFTQSFTSIAYNVTAVEQQNSAGYGPAYLLNGLSNQGYWYQVGLSWNWGGSGTYSNYSPGFNFNYEVFDSSDNSIFPTNGGGGLSKYSGPINQGDTVVLSLNFSGANVTMYSRDLNTSASVSISYSAEGATSFQGMNQPSSSNGFFTGLMTEEYHANPFYGNEQAVTYSDKAFALASGFMWIDEFNVNNGTLLFENGIQVSYSNPIQLQSYSLDGATEYSNAYEFITGAIASTTTTITLLPGGQSTPLSTQNEFAISYIWNGVQSTLYTSGGTVTVSADANTQLAISGKSTGSTSSEMWVLDALATSVSLNSGAKVTYYYYDVLSQPDSYFVFGGGNPSSPALTYFGPPWAASGTFSGSLNSVALSQSSRQTVWPVRGSNVSVSNPIPGTPSEQWSTQTASWTVTGPNQIPSPVPYYHQFYISIIYLVSGGGSGYGAPTVTCQDHGSQSNEQVIASAWVDAESACTYSQTLPGSSQNERWDTSSANVSVTGPGVISTTYYYQYSLGIDYQISGGNSPTPPTLTATFFGSNSTVSLPSSVVTEWPDAGSQYSLSNPLSSSTQSERWITTSVTSGTLDVPATISATFYHQFLISVDYVVNSGTPSPPSFNYTSFANPDSLLLTSSLQPLWADSGTYSASSVLVGSNSTVRWFSPMSSGTVQAAISLTFTYHEQFLLSISGARLSSQWFDSGSTAVVSVPGVYGRSDGSGQRVTSYSVDGAPLLVVQPTTGNITVSVLMDAMHQLVISSVAQYQVNLDSSTTQALASITPPTISGDRYWYDAGTPVSLVLEGTWDRTQGTGARLASYSVNGKTMNVATTGQVSALTISSLSSPQIIMALIVTQYRLTTNSGSVYSITAPPIPADAGWYDSGTKVTVVYDYSWNLTSAQSRQNAISYTIDQGATNTLSRAGSGTFSVQTEMGTPHSITVASVTQYGFSISGGNNISVSQHSPTNDSFFDAGTSLMITSDYTWNLVNGNTRQNLLSYTLDGKTTNVTRAESGNFTSPTITFDSAHAMTFNQVTQYLVSLQFKDNSGADTITPTYLGIEVYNTSAPAVVLLPTFQVWLDSGAKFLISILMWEGTDVKPANRTASTVGAPLNDVVRARVYDAKLRVTDYLGIPISGAQVTFVLVNGTTVKATTSGDGSISLRMIPLGTFQASIAYLGMTTNVAGDASTQPVVTGRVFASYPMLGLIGGVIIVALLAGFFLYRRTANPYPPERTAEHQTQMERSGSASATSARSSGSRGASFCPR